MYKKIFIGSGYLKLRKSKSILGTTTEVILESLSRRDKMSLDEIEVFYEDVIIGELLYSVNNEVFFYRVYTKDNKELVYKYSKEQHKNIQDLKEGMRIIKIR